MKKILWALLDDRMGSVGQARGVAQALSADFETVEKKVVYTPLAKLPNCIKGASLLGTDAASKKILQPPFPDLVISASRRTAPLARWIKKQSGGRSKIIQIMYPSGTSGLSDFDLVFVSEHDRSKAKAANVRYVIGSPHRINAETLRAAAEKWSAEFAGLPRPLTTVIIGGSIKGRPFPEETVKKLTAEIKAFKSKCGGSVLITDSKRTGTIARDMVMNALKDFPVYTYLWGEKKDNPYLGFLACCDNVVVTGDSVSMSCESCGTGKPVYIFTDYRWLTPKHLRFVNSLFSGGCAAPLEKADLAFHPQKTLNAAQEIAALIKALF